MNFEILILGPVELRRQGRREIHGSGKNVRMLAALALDAGRAVPLDTLVQRLWDDDPPAKPRASLHSYATRIRARLGPDRLRHEAHAYTLEVEPDTVDQHRHERLATQARSLAASGDDTRALALLRQADALWRGEPLTGMAGLWVEEVRRTLGERRLAARLLRTEIELRMGHFTDLAGELAALVERYPLDEVIARHYMTAAYGCGRQTDALRTFESLRRALREEGAEPGEALSRAYRAVLNHAPVTDLLTGRAPGAQTPQPNNLPAHGRLIGRADQLRALRTPSPGSTALHAISGMAGTGKTLLALHTARLLARHYPDGQIVVHLAAHSSGGRPLTPETALATLLRQFGVPATGLPHELADLTTLWRTLLSTRRAVIILDDASDAAQLLPLLPGTSPSLILVTSRRRLSGLPGVHHVFLDTLSTKEAADLFTSLVAPERAQDQTDISTLTRLCDHLPLAIELAAGRLNSRPTWTVSHLVQRMSRGSGKLAELRDGGSEIVSAFTMSYNTLPADQRKAFRLLGLHHGTDFGAHSAAALTGLPLERTERILESLQDSHLIREPAPERFSRHDLIAEYALTLTVSLDSVPVREEALDRLSDFYLRAVLEADHALNPLRPRTGPPLPPSPYTLPVWSEPQQAKAWIVAEHTALTAATRHARHHGRPGRAAHLAHALAGFLDSEGYWEEAEEMHTFAVDHWRTEGDAAQEARALTDLALVRSQTGQYAGAEVSGLRALSTARAAGDTETEAEALRALGLLYWYLGRLDESLECHHSALTIKLASGDPWQIARYKNNLGITVLHMGDHAKALNLFREALTGFIQKRDLRGEAQALNNLADGYQRMGERESAHDSFTRVLDIVMRVGSRSEQAIAQLNKANTTPIPAKLEDCLNLHRKALFTFRRIGDRRNETVTLNAIGTALFRARQYAEAAAHHTTALSLAKEIGAAQEQAAAHCGLGAAELRSGRRATASRQLMTALSLAQHIHAPQEEAQAYATLAELELAAGRPREALSCLKKALSRFEPINRFEYDRIRKQVVAIEQSGLHQ
ncbi:tetratricopeptide repeat protein [Streptomyces niveus]|uniref:AfsR/SARP family transcriptional regulator n=1 Tax=Streptomyces niveus TaxID=193462 RepID=UPI00369B02C5